MKKQPKFKMEFLDEGDFVKVMLFSDESLFCDYENEEGKPVRVRAPLPDKERIIKMAKHWVEHDHRWESVEHWISFYIKCRNKEIFEQVQEVRKSVKRINRYTESKAIATDALNEYIKNET